LSACVRVCVYDCILACLLACVHIESVSHIYSYPSLYCRKMLLHSRSRRRSNLHDSDIFTLPPPTSSSSHDLIPALYLVSPPPYSECIVLPLEATAPPPYTVLYDNAAKEITFGGNEELLLSVSTSVVNNSISNVNPQSTLSLAVDPGVRNESET